MTNKNYTKEQQDYIDEIKKGIPESLLQEVVYYKGRARNSRYYDREMVYGKDYVACPFTDKRSERKLEKHFLKIPNIDIDKLYSLFPELSKGASVATSKARQQASALMEDANGNNIIGDDGKPLTVAQYAALQSINSRTTKGSDGLSSAERASVKRIEAMSNDINEYGMNGSIQQQLNIHYNKTAQSVGKRKTDFENYKETQNYVTYYSPLYTEKKEIGKIKRIVSIREGFDNNISPILILRLENIVYNDYINKKESFGFRLNELLMLTGYTKERSDYEYQLYQDAIQASYDTGDAFSNVYILYHIAKYYDYKDHKEDVLEIIKTIFKR